MQTLTDIGGQDLLFEYREVPGGYNPTPKHAGAPIVGSVPATRPENPLVFTGVAPAGYVPPVQQAPSGTEGIWETRADSPFVSMDNVFVEYDGLGYLVGGYGAGGAVGIYDPATDSWTTGATEPAPQIQYVVDGCFGFDGGGDPVVVLFNDTSSGATTLHRYNITTNSWDTPPVPTGFPGNGLWALDILSLWKFTGDNVCYISGGATAPGGGDTSALYAYYPDTNTAVNLGDFTHHPTGFAFHASWYMPEIGAICVGGGVDVASGVFPDTQCYDLAGGTFNAPNADLGPMLEGVWGMADGFLYEGGDFQLWITNGADAGFALWQRSMFYSTATGTWSYGPDPLYGVYRVEGTNVPDATGCHFYVSTGSAGGFSPTSYLERNFSAECPTFAVVDVPWLWENPVSGTVPVDTSFDDEIGFTSFYTEVPTGTVVHLPFGTYTATLRLTNNDPVVGSLKVPVTMHIVAGFLAPEASFDALTPVCLDVATIFTNTTSGGVPPASSYLWDFGDGITSTLENPTHVYGAAGTYTVTLEACNEEDLCDTASGVVEVLPLPAADFTFVVSNLIVTFTNGSANADTYLWDFGDGITSTLDNPVHTYAANGTYTVTLSATGVCGTDVAIAPVTVYLPPVWTVYLPVIYKTQAP